MKPKTWTIYCHIHVESGRRYIGLTIKTMMHRWNQHCAQAKSSKGGRWHFPNAIRKYGKDAFSHEVLEICSTLEEANAAEERWIDFYDSRNPEKGFNLAKGGQHVPHPIRRNPWDNPEYRSKQLPGAIARINTPEARAASKAALNTPGSRAKRSAISKEIKSLPGAKKTASHGFRGKKHSPETRLRLITLNSSRSHSEETRKKISESMKGKRPSDSSIEKTRMALTGRPLSMGHRAVLSTSLKLYHSRKAAE